MLSIPFDHYPVPDTRVGAMSLDSRRGSPYGKLEFIDSGSSRRRGTSRSAGHVRSTSNAETTAANEASIGRNRKLSSGPSRQYLAAGSASASKSSSLKRRQTPSPEVDTTWRARRLSIDRLRDSDRQRAHVPLLDVGSSLGNGMRVLPPIHADGMTTVSEVAQAESRPSDELAGGDLRVRYRASAGQSLSSDAVMHARQETAPETELERMVADLTRSVTSSTKAAPRRPRSGSRIRSLNGSCSTVLTDSNATAAATQTLNGSADSTSSIAVAKRTERSDEADSKRTPFPDDEDDDDDAAVDGGDHDTDNDHDVASTSSKEKLFAGIAVIHTAASSQELQLLQHNNQHGHGQERHRQHVYQQERHTVLSSEAVDAQFELSHASSFGLHVSRAPRDFDSMSVSEDVLVGPVDVSVRRAFSPPIIDAASIRTQRGRAFSGETRAGRKAAAPLASTQLLHLLFDPQLHMFYDPDSRLYYALAEGVSSVVL